MNMNMNVNMDMGMQMDMDMDMSMDAGMDAGMNDSSFCMTSAQGTTMYMTGFQFTLFTPQTCCLNLLFANWTLDTRTKFIAAMIFVTLIGIITEGVPVMRAKFLKRIKVTKMNVRSKSIKLLLSSLHGLQILLGYILMLAAMTYSIELLLSTVLGLILGYLIFEKEKHLAFSPSIQTQRTPCCESLDDDFQSISDKNQQPDFEYIRLKSENSPKSDYRSTSPDLPEINGSIV